MKSGGFGVIEEGKLKGRKFIVPSEVWVEKGTFLGGVPQFEKACLIHGEFIPDDGCQKCQKEKIAQELKNKSIGL